MERISLVDNNRQEGMLESLNFNTNDHHIIIGCGGIGFWLGLMLTMIGAEDIVVMDGDKIDNSNLSRLPVPQTWVGQNKAVALRKVMRQLRPDVRCVCFTTHITEDTLGLLEKFSVKRARHSANNYPYNKSNTTVWDTTDDAKIQVKINAYVKSIKEHKGRVVYRKIGYEAFEVGSYADFSVWTQDDYTPGYRTTSANAVSSILAAGLGFLGRYLAPNADVQIDLQKLIMKEAGKCTKKTKKKAGTQVQSVS